MQKEIRNGMLGGIFLLFFYFLVMTVASRSWSATISQFKELWYWMIILSSGFGIQIGLYTHIKNQISKIKNINQKSKILKGGKSTTITTGTTSSISMIACCAHHLTEVLPIIGLSGLAVFLTRYQIPLIVLGIVMNGFGIAYMLNGIHTYKKRRPQQ